jgi:purine-binding chemotaxis protein CheW
MLTQASTHKAASTHSDAVPINAPAAGGWLVCCTGVHRCAIPLAHVIETMRLLPIKPLAGAPSYVRGLCIIRGAPVPVVDIGMLLGGEAIRFGRLVAIRADIRIVALAVEAIEGIRVVGSEAFHHLPPLLRDVGAAMIAAIATLDDDLLLCLRTARIVPDDLRVVPDGAAP